MQINDSGRLCFAWWNTGLAPAGKPKGDVDLEGFLETVAMLLGSYNVDFLALGEVSEREAGMLDEQLSGTSLRVSRCFNEVNSRSRFSQAYLYNDNKLRIIKRELLIDQRVDRNLRIGERLVLETSLNLAPLNLVISHWPSLMHSQSDTREFCASSLRNQLISCGIDISKEPIMLIGDFNSEPFEAALTTNLQCSRDLALVKKKRQLLFNPFWNKLGSCVNSLSAGTHYYAGGIFSKWVSFDQIIVSSSIACGTDYKLVTDALVVRDDKVLNLVKNSKQPYDHLPIVTVIEAAQP